MASPQPAEPTESSAAASVRAGIAYYVPSILVMLALVLVWQFAVMLLGVKEYILPTPLQAVRTLAEQALLEETQRGDFDAFVAAYNSHTLCGE